MTIYDLKPAFQNLLRPLVKKIYQAKITPNQITTFTCLLSVGFGLFLYLSQELYFYLLPLFFFFRMALNAIDGMLAKEHNLKTNKGALLNEVTDVLSDGFLYYAFLRFSFINRDLLMFVIFFSALTEVMGLAALLIQKPRQYAGPMGKSDRAFIFSVFALLITFNVLSAPLINGLLLGMAFLLILTIYNRANQALR